VPFTNILLNRPMVFRPYAAALLPKLLQLGVVMATMGLGWQASSDRFHYMLRMLVDLLTSDDDVGGGGGVQAWGWGGHCLPSLKPLGQRRKKKSKSSTGGSGGGDDDDDRGGPLLFREPTPTDGITWRRLTDMASAFAVVLVRSCPALSDR
jgi:hypothetical protein